MGLSSAKASLQVCANIVLEVKWKAEGAGSMSLRCPLAQEVHVVRFHQRSMSDEYHLHPVFCGLAPHPTPQHTLLMPPCVCCSGSCYSRHDAGGSSLAEEAATPSHAHCSVSLQRESEPVWAGSQIHIQSLLSRRRRILGVTWESFMEGCKGMH